MGGFTHLLNTFINLDIKHIDTFLTLKCIENLIILLNEFLQSEKNLTHEVLQKKEPFLMKCINLIDLISDYSLAQEKKRGESFEDI